MNKRSLIVMCAFLSACQAPQQILVSPTDPGVVYPLINHPDKLHLQECKMDMPRDLARVVEKNTEVCKTSQDKKSDRYKQECLEHPIVSSNIMIGFDQQNYNCFVANMSKIRAALQGYYDRVEMINSQRTSGK